MRNAKNILLRKRERKKLRWRSTGVSINCMSDVRFSQRYLWREMSCWDIAPCILTIWGTYHIVTVPSLALFLTLRWRRNFG